MYYNYCFHHVGQGLFASGALSYEFSSRNFNWVFDCGSMAAKRDLLPQVSRYKDFVLRDGYLDLLCISHFDYDHVSGLSELLTNTHIDKIVIPYYTPLTRLVLGARLPGYININYQEYYDFLSNPIAFILERALSVKQIYVVYDHETQSGKKDNDSPSANLADRDIDDNKVPSDTNVNSQEDWGWGDEPDSTIIPDFSKQYLTTLKGFYNKVKFINLNFQLSVNLNCNPLHIHQNVDGTEPKWEFLFFHKPENLENIRSLCSKIDDILRESNQQTLAGCLQNSTVRNKIRDAYHEVFPDNEQFNSAGVCMYAGGNSYYNACDSINRPRIWHGFPIPYLDNYIWHRRHHRFCSRRAHSILYSGDADFKPQSYRKELRNFLTEERWKNIYILQVPHHGSRHNWQEGLAKEFFHRYSVFSADPLNRKFKHPHREVLLDLLEGVPLLVDRNCGVAWNGIFSCY